MAEIDDRLRTLKERLDALGSLLHVDEKRERAQALEAQQQAPGFWNDQDAARQVTQELASLNEVIGAWQNLQTQLRDTSEILTLAREESDNTVLRDVETSVQDMEAVFGRLETQALFSGEYDHLNTIVTLHAGAGGTDAQDWTEILTRMFIRFAESQSWSVSVLNESRGEEAGYKSVQLAIRGHQAYGHFRSEAGVHRLVRISPFDAEKMRHTAFALVEVIPELDALTEKDIEIRPEDLRIDTFMSSGKGGQSVNTTYSAIRITHLPTNTVVTCQNERSQQQNKETAMRVLKSRLWKRLQEEQKEQIEELKGGHTSAEWGSQIRSYVLHPYKQIKDHRSQFLTQDVQAVLDGDLLPFIEAFLRFEAEASPIE